MTSKGGMQFKILLKKNGVVFLAQRMMQILFVGFSQTKQIHCCKNFQVQKKIGIKTTEEYYWHIRNKYKDFVNNS